MSLSAPFGISIITYVIGLVFYAMHLPECIWPGKFNYWGSSHQVRARFRLNLSALSESFGRTRPPIIHALVSPTRIWQ